MEVTFDNKSNVLTAKLHTTVDDAVVYTLETSYGFRGRRITILKDANPAPGQSTTVGALNWREKTIEVNGLKKKVGDVKKRKGSYFRNARFWQWASERKEYEIKYKNEEWRAKIVESGEEFTGRGKATDKAAPSSSRSQLAESSARESDLSVNVSTSNDGDGSTTIGLDDRSSSQKSNELEEGVVGRFKVPFRPHLFTKSKPPVMKLSRAALAQDEVFLILVLIYSEAKRQDQTNTSITSEG
ncbi:hypothetical protein L218DRAFT_909998 [Marasmius fiardii PR-910]|nr:hypothetical protein L218DRAFT_909998 [Marasmius fiardii PR-910]